jgi:hypothetical protein
VIGSAGSSPFSAIGYGTKLKMTLAINELIMLDLSLRLSAPSSADALKDAATPHKGGSDADRRERI